MDARIHQRRKVLRYAAPHRALPDDHMPPEQDLIRPFAGAEVRNSPATGLSQLYWRLDN